MNRFVLLLTWWLPTVALTVGVSGDEIEFFESRIRPVLVAHCYECHSKGSDKIKGGLRLDFRDGVRTGGESGPAITPGKPAESALIRALRYESLKMPPKAKLPDRVIADFEHWIRMGAADPRANEQQESDLDASWDAELARRSHWWSLQPPTIGSPPVVNDDAWSREPIDRFVRSSLKQSKLAPSAPAHPQVLLRRLSFVLTGLPPHPDQVVNFPKSFAENADQVVTELVDRLLSSPHFGERLARHWMDVVRYADTYGYEWDNPAKGAWEYRDYLIRAFNQDIGFDQLIREQIAGDLLVSPRINAQAGLNESLIGPMFYHMGEHRHGNSLDFNGIHQDMINNKIDAFSKAFLGMTVACARCHDHKLDAISQKDYYALAGVFMSPRWTSRVIDVPEKYASEISELTRLRDGIQHQLSVLWQNRSESLASTVRQWSVTHQTSIMKSKIEDIAYPLARLSSATETTLSEVWTKLATEWKSTREARLKTNAEKFSVLTDFSSPGFPDGWATEGDGITYGYVQHGTPLIQLEGSSLIEEILPRGYHTRAISAKLPGAIRLPPLHVLSGRHISLQLRGSEWAGYQVVPQNAFQSDPTFLQSNSVSGRWLSIADKNLKNGVTRVFAEVAAAPLNPNFPPRTGLAVVNKVRLPDNDDGFDKRSWFSMTGIVAHEAAGTPQDSLDTFVFLFEHEPPTSLEDAWQRVGQWFSQAVDRWTTNDATWGDVQLLNWLLKQQLMPNQPSDSPSIAALVDHYRETESQIGFPRVVNSMDERGVAPLNCPLDVRGNVDDVGPAIPRNFLTVFRGTHRVGAALGSGRLELAQHLSSRANPQTARVFVNRVWQWIFGTGIVDTPNDFGKLGGRPSHPELLDWLSIQFMEEGWSTKKLIRRLVMSQTFRQSGEVSEAGRSYDPENRLLHHYPTRRLEAEAIRDNLLTVSGRLDPKLYGSPINPPRGTEDGKKRLFSGPVDSFGRRSLYIEMSIMDPPKFLVGFNLPDLRLPTGRRDVTNVPAQALIMLNDQLVLELASFWANHVLHDNQATEEDRVRSMFIQALGRVPSDKEIDRWTIAVSGFALSKNVMSDKAAWADLAHAFFNTKEFIYYR